MNIFLQLMKITGSSVEPSLDEKMKSKAFGVVMSILIVLFLFIPVTVFVGFIVYALTNGLVTLGAKETASAGLGLMLHIVALFSVVFGFSVVMSVFYFSSDLEYLLPLPIHPMKIVGAKLASTMVTENVMEAILVVSSLAGFMIGYGFSNASGGGLNIVSFLAAIIGVFTFPVVPICYCAIVCLIVMYFSKFFKNKDRVSKITAFSSIFLIIVLTFCLNLSQGFDTDKFVEQLINNDLGIVNVLDKIFVTVPLLSHAMAGSFVSLLLYIVVNALCVAIVLLLASKLYLPAVVALTGGEGSSDRKAATDYEKAMRESSPLMTYFKKELKILIRTPAYMSNCMAINLIWPVFIYLFIVLQKQSGFFGNFVDNIRAAEEDALLYMTLLVFGVSVILTALNCLASSAITREGKHFEIMKYMPVDIMTQINAKALVSIVISGSGLIIYIISSFAILGIDMRFAMYCAMLSILAVIYSTYLGIYLDTINPKLVWEDEVNALRGNYHVFYNMAIELMITAAVCGAFIGLFKLGFLPIIFIQIIILLLTAFLSFEFYMVCKNKGVQNIEKLEM